MAEAGREFTLAHLSDLHATRVAPRSIVALLGKRGLGFLSWRLRRRAVHRSEVLEALLDDLSAVAPDQIAITGDLTNLSLEDEFGAAQAWLRRVGSPQRVTAVPGNHDAYVRVERARSWDLWAEYLASDSEGRALLGGTLGGDAGAPIEFPSVRVRAPVALIGVCSAMPTPPGSAAGEVGAAQLVRLEHALRGAEARSLHRVVLIHHPPEPRATARRRRLRDAGALCAVLRRAGAELVLHGHLHRTRISSLEGPRGPIPVVCARSASDGGPRPHKWAQYHLIGFDVAPGGAAGGRLRISLRSRGWSPETGRFADAGAARELLVRAI